MGQKIKHVMVVDDDESVRHMLQMRISNEGYEVSSAVNGKHALQMIQARQPDLIVCDFNMPLMTGHELYHQLKNTLKMKIPFIMVTAVREKEKVVEIIKSGVTDYIVKPFDTKVLLEKIERHIKASEDSEKKQVA